MDKKEIIAFFDRMAPEWDKDLIRNEEAIEIILNKGEVKEGVHILDVACGTGALFPDYINRDVKVTGIDISPEMVKAAKDKFPDVQVICADAQTYNFAKQFDAVMIYNAFPHFDEPRRLFENLHSALKIKGRLTVAHGMSEKELQKCHSEKAGKVSSPLPSKEKLAEMMSSFFRIDVMISDEKMYMVSGVKF
ncbi:MAG: methyltransferase domain-containing protein [Clostridia bacterium]|nr:methyltransferase domain-containing protein [Clostridia bacterium]